MTDPIWLAVAAVSPVAVVELARWGKRWKARRRYAAAKSSMGLRPQTAPVPVDPTELTDHCLRGGYHLYDAQWLACRTIELNGDLQAAEHELTLLRQPRS
jgi:hypothetical protein